MGKVFKFYLIPVLMVTAFLVQNVDSFKIPGVGGKSESSSAVDIETTTKMLNESFIGATQMLGKTVYELAVATDMKEEAERMQEVLDDIDKNNDVYKKDPDASKETFNAINHAAGGMKEVDLNKMAKNQEKFAHVFNGLLYSGSGVVLDKKAMDYAETLIDILPDEIKANPMEALKLKKVLSTAKMIAAETPTQLNNTQGVLTNLTKYALANDIPAPTESETLDVIKDAAPSAGISVEDF